MAKNQRRPTKGICFNKIGFWTTILVFILSLITVASGSNNLYLFLSLSLAVFVVSGINSEKVIKSIKIAKSENAIGPAGKSINLHFFIKNTSPSSAAILTEYSLFKHIPKYKFVNEKREPPLGKNLVYSIDSSATTEIAIAVKYESRGIFRDLFLMTTTSYPFGFIEKFRIKKIPTEVIVYPKIDQDIVEKIGRRSKSNIIAPAGGTFYAYKKYSPGMPLKYLDWKKNAGRQVKDWVIKMNKSEFDTHSPKVNLPINRLLHAPTEYEYELILTEAASLLYAYHQLDFKPILVYRNDSITDTYEQYKILAGLPRFAERQQIHDWKYAS